ncbi:hypothetical protein [Proteiniclasticum sp.]|uniref:hypothetical protein n=1 Tax=Proteiniclasticum sp. TaxID=2053595 RepID=UPI0028A0AB28|nr:hypothetical protein [Proteiniclasticum sp.]
MDEMKRDMRITFYGTLILFIGFFVSTVMVIYSIKDIADFMDIIGIVMTILMTLLMGYISFYSMRTIAKNGNTLILWHSINDIIDVILLSLIIGLILEKGIPILAFIIVILGTFAWKYFFYFNILPIKDITKNPKDYHQE